MIHIMFTLFTEADMIRKDLALASFAGARPLHRCVGLQRTQGPGTFRGCRREAESAHG